MELLLRLECLWLRPGLARGVLSYLASTQNTEVIPEQDAEPGKILHETRNGEMATLKEMPFGRYYGGVDATPLFVLLAGSYFERSGDRAFAESLWPNVEAALQRIDGYTAIGTAMASWSTSGKLPKASSTRGGRIPTMPFPTQMARRLTANRHV